MKTTKWTIVHIEETEIVGGWAHGFREENKSAGSHDNLNYIVTKPPKGYEGEVLDIADLIAACTDEAGAYDLNIVVMGIAKWLLDEDRSIPIVGTPDQMQMLYEDPMYQLWCDNYQEDSPQRKIDHNSQGLSNYRSNNTTSTIRKRIKELINA